MEDDLNKKFYGRWLWTDADGLEVNSGVAETRGGRYLVYWRHGQGGTGYAVYDRVEDIEDDGLRHKVEAILGDGAEFLDI